MVRKIIQINEELCNGCGLCVQACHEGAIGIVDGKAKLLRDDYCDGLGNCLPACPTGAITFVEREALAYDEQAVKANMQKKTNNSHNNHQQHQHMGCSGTRLQNLKRDNAVEEQNTITYNQPVSRLSQWPLQIKLVPVNAPYFDGAKLLVAADCTAYARADFHERFIKNHITLIGCPKLDMTEYADKLTEIIKINNIHSVTVVRMEVPCCGGIEHAVKTALQASGKFIPWQVVTIAIDGTIL